MLDNNGIYKQLDFNTAQTQVMALADSAGVVIDTGSVEEQIQNWLAQFILYADSAEYAMYVKMFNPTGSDIDLQNPGTPRLLATISSGYLKIDNSGGGTTVSVTANQIFAAPNGNQYTTALNTLTVLAGAIGYIAVYSVLIGSSQNIPSGLTFTSSLTAVVTNPQPFVTGSDRETDTQYISRLVYLKSNNTSVQATPAATKELLTFYSAARIYINNTANNYTTPIPVPTGGYVAVVLFPSGITAGAEEIQNAINIISNRFEFGNILSSSTTVHPLLSGVNYTGTLPQVYTVAPAQAVISTLTAGIQVSFPLGTTSAEKKVLVTAFATAFVQNLIDFYGGVAGNFNLTFNEAGSPTPSPVASTPVVVASSKKPEIATLVTIEQIRSFISDNVNTVANIFYRACSSLQLVLNPNVAGQPSKTLNIDAPSSGHVASVDFVNDALFNDSTSWYDRYIWIDPSLFTVTVTEI